VFGPDEITRQAVETVETYFGDHPGSVDGFQLPINHDQLSEWVDDFVKNRLRLFGMYQDAMLTKSHVVYHSRLSVYLNHGLIEPIDLMRNVEAAYREGSVPLNSAEGFIRQVLGWREYVHGVYWMRMPEYREQNPLDYEGEVPENDANRGNLDEVCQIRRSVFLWRKDISITSSD
jgi:deoxyribodipyrimidine photolyase-related protein